MEIGVLLRKLRDELRMSSRETAEKIGVTQSTYLDWEHDKSSPTIKMFFRIAKAFNICPIELMSLLSGKTRSNAGEQQIEINQLTELVKNIQLYLNQRNTESMINLGQSDRLPPARTYY